MTKYEQKLYVIWDMENLIYAGEKNPPTLYFKGLAIDPWPKP